MGNCLGIQFAYYKLKAGAVKSLKFFWKDEKKPVIEIHDADEENQVDVSDDSSIEEVEIVGVSRSKWKGGYRALENSQEQKKKKDLQSLDSSMATDVSNMDGKLDAMEKMIGVMLLNQEPDALGLPAYENLYDSVDIEYNEKCLRRLHLLPSKKKGGQIKEDVVKECFLPLTEEEEDLVAHALSNSNRRQVLVSHANSNIDITGEKLQCLSPGAWLNDEVINLYLELLKEREKREHQKFLKCHFFNTFFYKKLISGEGSYNFQSVRRWTTKRKLGYCLLDCEKIFVPIHKETHWCLAIINKKDKKFQYLDSLKRVDSKVLNVLARYYVDVVKDKIGEDIDVTSWEEEFVRNLPQQENGFDCGMFMIKYADFYSRDIGLCFNQRDMPYFRQRTAKEILKLRAE